MRNSRHSEIVNRRPSFWSWSVRNATSPWIKNHIVIGSADENALEEEGRQQPVFLSTRKIFSGPQWCHERDAAKGTGTNPHILGWQDCKGLLCFAHVVSLQGSSLQ